MCNICDFGHDKHKHKTHERMADKSESTSK